MAKILKFNEEARRALEAVRATILAEQEPAYAVRDLRQALGQADARPVIRAKHERERHGLASRRLVVLIGNEHVRRAHEALVGWA